MGASAGCNVACPTISTTNDMPIVEPPSLAALALINFQINTHYVENEYEGLSSYTGESRKQRLEYVNETQRSVVGLPEGTGIRVLGGRHLVVGKVPVVVVTPIGRTFELPPGDIPAEILASLKTSSGQERLALRKLRYSAGVASGIFCTDTCIRPSPRGSNFTVAVDQREEGVVAAEADIAARPDFVPRCRMMMLPATTCSPPYFLTPRRRPSVSRPLRDEPPAFLCAIWALLYAVECRPHAAP